MMAEEQEEFLHFHNHSCVHCATPRLIIIASKGDVLIGVREQFVACFCIVREYVCET